LVATCAGTQLAARLGSGSTHQAITDPNHVTMATELRTRLAVAHRRDPRTGPRPWTGVGQRGPSHLRRGAQPLPYPPFPAAAPDRAGRAVTAPRSALAGRDAAGDLPGPLPQGPVIAATFTALGDRAREEGWSRAEYLAAVLGPPGGLPGRGRHAVDASAWSRHLERNAGCRVLTADGVTVRPKTSPSTSADSLPGSRCAITVSSGSTTSGW